MQDVLRPAIAELDLVDVGGAWSAMVAAAANIGRQGFAATAISAVDLALWDLKARAQGMPRFRLLGPYRDSVPIYGSGGFTSYTFTSYTMDELTTYLAWKLPESSVAMAIPEVQVKDRPFR
ncbi:MAG: hypothetical protein M3Z65_01130 [Chloroflexota bacterium]|nr:hypothetical protein [Chloroflexota bacterium]